MQRYKRFRTWNRAVIAIAAILLLSLTVIPAPLVVAGGRPAPDVAGDWEWHELVVFVAPDEVVMSVFGIAESEGPVMRVFCEDSGVFTLVQNGDAISGIATQNATCRSAGGQIALTPPLPPFFEMSGHVTGSSVHFNVDFEPVGISCPYEGSLTLQDGVAVELNATGRCSFEASPFHPNMTKNVSFDARRL